jgi:PAS domain S-box-containing protein
MKTSKDNIRPQIPDNLLFGSLMEYSSDLVYFKDRQSRYIRINKELAKRFGLEDPEQAVGKTDFDFLPHEEAKKTYEDEQQIIRTGKPIIGEEKKIRRSDGGVVWFSRAKIPLRDGKGKVIGTFGISRDITDQKLTKEELKKHQEHLEDLVKERASEFVSKLEASMRERYRFGDLVGKSEEMQQVYELILKCADSDANMVVYGETGTGKELVAKIIHDLSQRSVKPFVVVNCGAIPAALFESEFFGHRKGAFTGAHQDKIGLFQAAEGGTLFLDELGELTPEMQVKLLRAIENDEYTPVGDTKLRKADVRLVAATNCKLNRLLDSGKMRSDFYYRMQVVQINIPPLRKRRGDIALLTEHFLEKFADKKKLPTIPATMMERLYNYDWPGNVRELQNVLQRFVTIGSLVIGDHQLDIADGKERHSGESGLDAGFELREVTKQAQKDAVLKALEQTHWQKGQAARLLRIGRKTLYRRMKEHGLL